MAHLVCQLVEVVVRGGRVELLVEGKAELLVAGKAELLVEGKAVLHPNPS